MSTPEEIYFKKIQELSKIKILIIGKDPYPKGANGVAFCKNSWDELFEGKETLENDGEQRCCGQDVLYSLGFEEEKARAKFKSPIDLWLYMLEKGVVMINIAHSILKKDEFIYGQATEVYAETLFKANEEMILQSKELNDPIIEKSDELFILGELATKCIFNHFYEEFKDKPREVLIHPSIRGKKGNKEKYHEWSETWRKHYLLRRVKYKLASLS